MKEHKRSSLSMTVTLVLSGTISPVPVLGQAGRIIVGDNVLVSSVESMAPHVEPHLAVNPADPTHLVAAAMQFGVEETVASFVSFDGGRSWATAPLPGCEADPWVAFDGVGTVYVSCLSHSEVENVGPRAFVDVRRSDNGGVTWQDPVTVPVGEGRSSDRPILLVDRSSQPSVGTVYSVRGQAFAQEGRRGWYGPSIARSTDGASSFSDPHIHAVNNLTNQVVDAAVLSDGDLAVVVHDFQQSGQHSTSTRSWLLLSDDGGRTMAPARFVLDTDVGRLAVDRSRSDRLHVVVEGTQALSGATYGPERSDSSHVFLLTSDNRGMEWSDPKRLSDGGEGVPRHHMPMAAVDQNGVLAVAWYDGRDDPAGACAEILFTASLDGGSTFLPSVSVSNAGSCPQAPEDPVPVGANRYPWGGDYNSIVAVAEGTFHLVWADSRNGRYQLWSSRVQVPAR